MHNAQELNFSLITHAESTAHDPTDYIYLEPNNKVGIDRPYERIIEKPNSPWFDVHSCSAGVASQTDWDSLIEFHSKSRGLIPWYTGDIDWNYMTSHIAIREGILHMLVGSFVTSISIR
jgi:hypothetical protein